MRGKDGRSRGGLVAAILLATILVVAALAPIGPAGATEPAPRVAIATANDLPQPLPLPYDEAADAKADVAAALARAAVSGKRVLIEFGGNWCPDCRVLAGVMKLPEVKPWLDRHFEVVAVDIGRMNKNLDIAARFGAGGLRGVPHVSVVEANGTVLNPSDTGDLPNARRLAPQAVVDWIARWARTPST